MAHEKHSIRSWLFTPGTRPERFAKAAEVDADVLIIDLEDAVAPNDKDGARAAALDYLVGQSDDGTARALRINALSTRFGLADLVALVGGTADPDFLVLPKTESAAHLQVVDTLLTTAEKRTRLVGLIESAKGLAAVDEIAAASPRVAGLMLGSADMAADLGAIAEWEPMLGVRSRIVAACALGGVVAIDTPFFDVHDADGLKGETARSVELGFQAKAAIHPAQIAAINAALTPDDKAVEEAHAILEANKKGVGVVNGKMIDEAVARKARRTLAAAGQPGAD